MEHPIIQSLNEATNDLVTWSNVCICSPSSYRTVIFIHHIYNQDLFSYNVEQSKGDTHNMISVVMNEEGLDLQTAVDFVGTMCKQSIDRFNDDKANLPSWGPKIDRDVAIYVDGLANWIVGSLHWSFESERYFGKSGREVKTTRVVNLLPRRR